MPGDSLIPVPEEVLWRPRSKRSSTLSNDAQHTCSRDIEEVIKRTSKRILQYESQMQELSIKLAEGLSNFRAMDSLMQGSLDELKRDTQYAKHALEEHIPCIHDDLDNSLISLEELSHTLPQIQSHVTEIRRIYDSGQKKAKNLVTDLTWLNTEWHERWRVIIFTNHSPVSRWWTATMRILFAATLITFIWITWVAIVGAYTAHRQRLVWGERLMS
ncbi:hypothetical protein BDR04DRAFT_1046851 [Suillus decipiens]|nr:hypothetical protein BDR04DRAFT_1046851 [Suillus decipiens]